MLLAAHENLNDRIAAGAKVAAHRSTLHRLAIDSASAGDHGAWWPPRAAADWLSLHLKWPSAVGQRRLGPYFLHDVCSTDDCDTWQVERLRAKQQREHCL